MHLRPSRHCATGNTPTEARFVRLFIFGTNRGQPCIDELEVYAVGSKGNLASAKVGAKATASSCLQGYAIHKIEHLNDGRYGNSHSWIAGGRENEWAQIELTKPASIDRIVFSRDRSKQHDDRIPSAFDVRVSMDGETWKTVRTIRTAAAIARTVSPGSSKSSSRWTAGTGTR